MSRLIIIIILLPFFLYPQNEIESTIYKKLPNDVRWVKKSSEYFHLCQQIYQTATIEIVKQSVGMKNPIIIMDLDETVLDNSKYQIELFQNGTNFSIDSWNNWVKKEVADLVPGAKDFILFYKQNPNARIIFLSNREHKTLKATKSNMQKLGVYFENDIFLLKKNDNDTKIVRRNEVLQGIKRMKKHGPLQVVAYFGDAIGDFPDDRKYIFGRNKFIFPNPMYGKW